MRVIGIIPARLDSSRVPRKPLVDICGLPMCVHVYRRTALCKKLASIVIATDSVEVVRVAESYGACAVLTRSDHRNGTERIAEVVETDSADIAVLINGDEALVNPNHIAISLSALVSSGADASILARQFKEINSPSDFKLVLNLLGDVMYISRGDIPCTARNPAPFMLKAYHVMAFWRNTLERYAKLDKTPLESIEDHEHLRLLEHGMRIKAEVVESNSISVDTLADLAYVRKHMLNDPFWRLYWDN
jgi:3-deoxy-manno-octulosonate cytidylyltransferase (CMP-KDO synthetase)